MKIAIVHEMLIKMGGAEKVLEDMLEIWPDADIFTLIYDEKKMGAIFPRERIKGIVTPSQRVYRLTRRQRLCLPWMPRAVESLDLSGYDIVVSASSGFAHGCITGADTRHVVYYHSPARYLWDWTYEVQESLGARLSSAKGIWGFSKWLIINSLFKKLRIWDYHAAQRHDVTLANSGEIVKRVGKYLHREAQVIYPAVDIVRFEAGSTSLPERDYYVITSTLARYKNIDLAVRACNDLGYRLKVVGSGAELENLRELAGPTVEILGRQSDEVVEDLYRHARGFLMPQREDFGIAPIEAMAAGLPVFWLAEGGLLETNVAGLTGDFCADDSLESFTKGLKRFDTSINDGVYDMKKISQHAGQFGREKFLKEFEQLVTQSQT